VTSKVSGEIQHIKKLSVAIIEEDNDNVSYQCNVMYYISEHVGRGRV